MTAEQGEGKQRIGLVLSGGSVRGAAHLGALEVLEREGIRPDCIVGTSVGALVGALYCGGAQIEQLKAMAKKLSWLKIGRLTRPRLGLLQAEGLEKMLIEIIGDRRFEELDIPFAAVATDIVAEEMVVLREGRVAPAVRASCAVPGLFTPLERDGRVLVDGGLRNNLPISVAREMGADYVIAIDLLPKTPDMRYTPGNIFEVILCSIYTAMAHNRHEAGNADCLIRPLLGDFGWASMSRLEIMIQKGRQATEAVIDQIKMDLELQAESGSKPQAEKSNQEPVTLTGESS